MRKFKERFYSRKFHLVFFSCVLIVGLLLTLTGCDFHTFSSTVHGSKGTIDNIGIGSADVVSRQSWSTDDANGISPAYAGIAYESEAYFYDPYMEFNTEEYSAVKENGFKKVVTDPVTTFSADVDTASYANLRRLILDNDKPYVPKGAVRLEEMINYFDYVYPDPEEGSRFGVISEIAQTPWNDDTVLLRIGLKADSSMAKNVTGSNLVFLVDVSGSMSDTNKLDLLKKSLKLLLDGNLTDKDVVSIVTYASGEEKLAEGLNAVHDKNKLVSIIDGLEASGSTNGEAGLKMAYQLAEDNFIEGGNNRIILCSDGDLNVGMTDESSLSEYVEKKADTGVYLTVLGFGTGNYSDSRMETIADDGNGNYYYIDSILEAEKVLCNELTQTLFTVADDVKFQIEFNPAKVAEYRQIGYENRAMDNQDFEDDTKDAGEVGAGQTVTVLYELKLADGSEENMLKYQNTTLSDAGNTNEWLTLKLRYKDPGASESVEESFVVSDDNVVEQMGDDFLFASAVAEFGMVLRDSEFKGSSSYESVIDMLKNVSSMDVYREEFRTIVGIAQRNNLIVDTYDY